MEGKEVNNVEASLRGQAEIWRLMFGYVDSMALKFAVELRIPDIINSHGRPISLSQIVEGIGSSAPTNITTVERIMRLLVRRNVFTATTPQSDGGGETLYGLTHSSKWILRDDAELSLAPMLLLVNHPLLTAPWHFLSGCVREGGVAFQKAHQGLSCWEYASIDPELNKTFNDGCEDLSKITVREIVSAYKDGFGSIGSLVDVGGGTGATMAEIVRAYPHVKGINFDQPHVIATAPEYSGVSHVGGDMFKDTIPCADAVLMKLVMHGWNDEDCVKILKNCRKAIPEKTGKIIIVDAIVEPDGDATFNDLAVVLDLMMMTLSSGGRERTELQWKKLLKEGGFPRYNIIKIPDFASIIEAYLE